MKPRSIAIAAAAGIALLVWIAWLGAHWTQSGPAPQAAATPGQTAAQTAAAPVTVVVPAGGSSPVAPAPVAPVATMPAAPVKTGTAPASGTGTAAIAAIGGSHQIDRAAAMIELQKVRTMIASYHTLMGQNPVGTNAEILKALMGGNPRQATLGPPPGQTLNARGELLDPWGTPYFFHQLSGDDMEIHSAGPDRIMWTKDDLVVH